jgi:hypothetical protein
MDRRELLGVLGAGAVGLSAITGREAVAGPEGAAKESCTDPVHADCMKACGECAKICNEAAKHCLMELSEGTGDRKHHARAHALANDCQAFCVLSATLIARDSELMTYSCEACAEACRCCAEECAKSHSELMKECAEKCRKCEATCRAMVKAMRGKSVT